MTLAIALIPKSCWLPTWVEDRFDKHPMGLKDAPDPDVGASTGTNLHMLAGQTSGRQNMCNLSRIGRPRRSSLLM